MIEIQPPLPTKGTSMCNEHGDLIKNNPAITLGEYTWAHVKALLVKWEWIKEGDTIPTSVTLDPSHEQKLAEARKAYEDKQALSDEDARKACEQFNQEQRAIFTRSKELLARAEAWQLPCEDQVFRDRVLSHLRKTAGSSEPLQITVEQYKRTSVKVAIEQLDEAEKLYRHNVRGAKNINDMLAAVRQSLGDPPAVAAKSE